MPAVVAMPRDTNVTNEVQKGKVQKDKIAVVEDVEYDENSNQDEDVVYDDDDDDNNDAHNHHNLFPEPFTLEYQIGCYDDNNNDAYVIINIIESYEMNYLVKRETHYGYEQPEGVVRWEQQPTIIYSLPSEPSHPSSSCEEDDVDEASQILASDIAMLALGTVASVRGIEMSFFNRAAGLIAEHLQNVSGQYSDNSLRATPLPIPPMAREPVVGFADEEEERRYRKYIDRAFNPQRLEDVPISFPTPITFQTIFKRFLLRFIETQQRGSPNSTPESEPRSQFHNLRV